MVLDVSSPDQLLLARREAADGIVYHCPGFLGADSAVGRIGIVRLYILGGLCYANLLALVFLHADILGYHYGQCLHVASRIQLFAVGPQTQ